MLRLNVLNMLWRVYVSQTSVVFFVSKMFWFRKIVVLIRVFRVADHESGIWNPFYHMRHQYQEYVHQEYVNFYEYRFFSISLY